jgi:hypothetical protein
MRRQIIGVVHASPHGMSGRQSVLYKDFARPPIRGDNS